MSRLRVAATLDVELVVFALPGEQPNDLIQDLLQCRLQVNQATSKQLAEQVAEQVSLAGHACDINCYWPVGAGPLCACQPTKPISCGVLIIRGAVSSARSRNLGK